MKKIIKQGLFETNSSSTHSICICTDDKLLKDMKYPEKLYFGIGEHGWEFETLKTAEDKANYLYTAILYIYDKKTASEKVNKLYDWLNDIGVQAEFEKPKYWNNDYLDNGYVDHGYELIDFINSIFRSPKLLYRYLFSEYSYVAKGNDNSDIDVGGYESYDHKEFYKGN